MDTGAVLEIHLDLQSEVRHTAQMKERVHCNDKHHEANGFFQEARPQGKPASPGFIDV